MNVWVFFSEVFALQMLHSDEGGDGLPVVMQAYRLVHKCYISTEMQVLLEILFDMYGVQ